MGNRGPMVMIGGSGGGWGLERELEGATGGSTVACELRRTAYDRITQDFGGAGETVERADQIGEAMQRARSSAVPYCINVIIEGVRSPLTEWQLESKAGRPR